MSAAEHFADRAVAIAALPATDPERAAAEAHARTCSPCAEALAEARSVMALLDALPPPLAPARRVMERTERAVLRDDLFDRLDRWAPPVVTAVAWIAFVLGAKHRATSPAAWALSAAPAALAVASTTAAQRGRGGPAIVAVWTTSALLVLVTVQGGRWYPSLGAECALIELAAAALPYSLVAYVAIRRRLELSAVRYAAIAAAGALAGQAALHLTCPAHTQGPHVAVFHLGGVILAGALGAAGARLARGFHGEGHGLPP